jgi:hypothetical protein
VSDTIKLEIISDGTRDGTKLVDSETGNAVEGLVAFTWSYDWNRSPVVMADVRLAGVASRLAAGENRAKPTPAGGGQTEVTMSSIKQLRPVPTPNDIGVGPPAGKAHFG